MGFWENVDTELKYQNKTRKQLAQELGFDPTTISKGIANNSVPLADMALKIADFLDVSLEYLLGIPEKSNSQNTKTTQEQVQLYKKYHDLIQECEGLATDKVKLLIMIAGNLEKK